MSRWLVRLLGLLMIVVFLLLLANLQRRLVELQQTQGTAPARAR